MKPTISKDITKRKLTFKQSKWIKEYIETGNATEAAMRVYDCKDRDSARALGSENLAKLSISELMEEMGLTDVALINIGAEGMTKANKSLMDGSVVPDYNVRRGYWETMLKLKGKLRDNPIINDTKILVIPGELANKYGVTLDTEDSSQGQS